MSDLDIVKSFEDHGVVPDVVPEAPSNLVKVSYGNGKVVSLGDILTPTQVKDEPVLITWSAESDVLYTLIMTDPDAPSRANPTLGEVKHWLVINIPGSDVEKGVEIAAYRGSGPPKGTGLHRYVFLVFKQKQALQLDEPRVPRFSREGRLNWSARKFAEKHSLELVAGNFYQAEWDEYVDTIPRS
ncbi:protein D3 [Galendromus occidentalis]|uniref:Protein D3 n=1 Tax=Galendromus occidentalis TaxID=34638 RepID=A0AAJ6QTZ3_9ACAR|nr:protein D3 [Galendromus occidentalis]